MGVFKNKFILAFLIFTFNLGAGELKIAVIGDSPKADNLADAVSAKFSHLPGFSVYERKEIKKVLDEHRIQKEGFGSREALLLANIIHADILVHIGSSEAKGGGVPSSFIIFDARNGFRLADTALPEGFDKCVAFAEEQIKKSMETAGRRKFISVLSMRNAGALEKYNYILANIVTETERRLLMSPDIAVLERSNLTLVNAERKLSGSTYALAPSAWLLDFEIFPGPSPDRINMVIHVLNVAGSELKKFTFEDCMKDSAGTTDAAVSALIEYFSITAPSEKPLSANEEAARFFKEYKFLSRIDSLDAAERKLEACIALQPNSPDYRRELALFIMKKAEKCPRSHSREEHFSVMAEAGKRAVEIMDGIKEQFPDYKKTLYCEIYLSPMENIFINSNSITPEQQRKAVEFANVWRPKCFEEMKKRYYQFDLGDGINSLKELEKYNFYCEISTRLCYYFDYHEALKARWTNSIDLLRRGAEFLRDNPDILKSLNFEKQINKFTCSLYFHDNSPQKMIEDFFRNGEDLILAAKEHPAPAVKSYGLLLELIRKTIIGNYDSAKFQADLDNMLGKTEKSPGVPLLSNAHSMLAGALARQFFRNHKEIDIAYHWKQIEYSRKHDIMPDWYFIRNYLGVFLNDTNGLAATVEQLEPEITFWLKSGNRQYLNEIEGVSSTWLARLVKGNKPEYGKAIEILRRTRSLSSECLFSVSGLGFSKHANVANAQMEAHKIYLLVRETNSILSVCEFDIDAGKATLIAKLKENKFQYLSTGYYINASLHVSEKFFLIGGENEIIAVSRDGQETFYIRELPAKEVHALAMLDGRVYAFLGRINSPGSVYAKETVLFSCLPDGSDRRIHISTLRLQKENFFDKQTPFIVANLFADEKNKRLLFLTENPIGGLWEFNPVSGENKILINFDRNSSRTWGMRIGSILYIAGSSGFARYYTFDMETYKEDFILLDNTPPAKYLRERPKYVHNIRVSPPFFARNDQLWFGGWSVVFIKTPALDKPKFENMLQGQFIGTMVFPHPDGVSAIAVTANSIYKITPPDNNATEKTSPD